MSTVFNETVHSFDLMPYLLCQVLFSISGEDREGLSQNQGYKEEEWCNIGFSKSYQEG